MNKLHRLFWLDTSSDLYYHLFGDVLGFYYIYRTNHYKRPLVIFVGVNNHIKTCIFGCGLLPNKDVDTYEWVHYAFLEAMNGKIPKSAITDGDKAMRHVISNKFMDAIHKLCSWNLHQNATHNIT